LTGSPLTKEIVAMERSRRREIPPQMSFERREEGMIWGRGRTALFNQELLAWPLLRIRCIRNSGKRERNPLTMKSMKSMEDE
jgi:hypothetical protein